MKTNNFWDRPCADAGLVSYRYKGRFGWIMIGAHDDADALREAARSLEKCNKATADNLQRWNGAAYQGVQS